MSTIRLRDSRFTSQGDGLVKEQIIFSQVFYHIFKYSPVQDVFNTFEGNKWHFFAHHHGEMEIMLLHKMAGHVLCDGTLYPLGPGSIIAVPPGSVHSFELDYTDDSYFTTLQFDFFPLYGLLHGKKAGEVSDFYLPNILCIKNREIVAEYLLRLFSLAQRENNSEAVDEQFGELALLASILSALYEEGKKRLDRQDKKNLAVQKIVDHIENHFKEDISLDSIAHACFISKYHMCRLFKKFTGRTVIEYINQLRINFARQELLEHGKNVSESCYSSGFTNLSYFIKVFTRLTGFSPRQWLKEHREKNTKS